MVYPEIEGDDALLMWFTLAGVLNRVDLIAQDGIT
jgi:hypothetical protein